MNPLFRVIAPRKWDLLLRCCGVSAALCIAVYLLLPAVGDLAMFTALMFLAAGPWGTFLPSTAEPIQIAYGTLYPPLLLAALSMPGVALAEWINYRLFDVVVHARQLESVRSAGITRRVTRWFKIAPALTIAVWAFSPVPFWMARTCSVLAGYPFGRHVVATMVGRFPRIWLVALFGSALPFATGQVALGTLALSLKIGAVVLWRAHAVRRRAVPVPSLR